MEIYDRDKDFACDRMSEMLETLANTATSDKDIAQGAMEIVDAAVKMPFFAGNRKKCASVGFKIAMSRVERQDNDRIAWLALCDHFQV